MSSFTSRFGFSFTFASTCTSPFTSTSTSTSIPLSVSLSLSLPLPIPVSLSLSRSLSPNPRNQITNHLILAPRDRPEYQNAAALRSSISSACSSHLLNTASQLHSFHLSSFIFHVSTSQHSTCNAQLPTSTFNIRLSTFTTVTLQRSPFNYSLPTLSSS